MQQRVDDFVILTDTGKALTRDIHLSLTEIGAHYGVSSSYTSNILSLGGVRVIKKMPKRSHKK